MDTFKAYRIEGFHCNSSQVPVSKFVEYVYKKYRLMRYWKPVIGDMGKYTAAVNGRQNCQKVALIRIYKR